MQVTLKPDPQQIEGVKFLLARNSSLLNFYTGSGKSIIIILACFILLERYKQDKILIACPKSAVLSFKDDFADNSDYAPFMLKTKEALYAFLSSDVKGIGVMQYNLIKQCLQDSPDMAKKIVKTYIDPKLKQLITAKNVSIFLDEFHTLKNPKADITVYFSELRPLFKKVHGLTATSFTRSLYDIYYLVNFLVPKFFGTKTRFTENFINVRLRDVFMGGRKRAIPEVVSYKNLDLLRVQLEQVMMVYNPELDMTTIVHEPELSDWDAYVDTATDLLSLKEDFYDDKEETSFSKKLIQLQYTVDRDINKLKILNDVVTEHVGAYGVLVYCDYNETVNVISSYLKSKSPDLQILVIDGATSIEQRDVIRKDFKASPSNKVIVITPAGGQSLNLQATNRIIFYNTPYDPGKFLQARGRIERQYSIHNKYYSHILQTKDTIDEYKYQRLLAQLNVMNSSLGLNLKDVVDTTSFNSELLQKLRNKLMWNPVRKVARLKTPKR